jgi:thiamine transport system permease protein
MTAAGRRERSVAPGPGRALTAVFVAVSAAFVALFFVWPVTTLLARALSWQGMRDVLTNPGIRAVARFTVVQAAASTLLTLLLGLPCAAVLARYRFPGRRLVQALVTVPFVLPTVVVGAAFLTILPESLHGTVWAVLAAHVLFNLAVVVRTVGTLWGQLDPSLEQAARTLGAGPWQVARHVTLPLLRPALVAASSVVFLFCFTSFGVVTILGGPRNPTIEVEIYRRTAQLGDLDGAAALALLQLLAIAALLWWWGRSQQRHARGLRMGGAGYARVPRGSRDVATVTAVVALTVAAVVVPLAGLVRRSLALGGGWSWEAYRLLATPGQRGVSNTAPLDSLWVSLRFAVAATLVAVVVGACTAFAIAYARRGRVLDTAVMLPLGTSAVTLGFGLLITFDTGIVDWRGSPVLIPLGHALIAIPFVVRLVLPVLRSVDPDLRAAAATLGAGPYHVWRSVDLPLVTRSLVVGAGFSFAISVGEFGATTFLTRRGQTTMPIMIGRLLGRPGETVAAQAYALATILFVVTLVAVLVVELARRDDGGVFG